MARWKSKVDRLFWTGTAARQAGELAPALAAHRLAEGDLRGRLRRHPDDAEAHEKLAAVLYSLGSSLVAAGQPEEAVKALDDSEYHYRRSAAADGELLIADVLARRAGAHARAGHPVSALTDIDQALTTYAMHGIHLQGPPRSLDLARVLSQAAIVHRTHGDVDQALTCAKEAMARYNEGYAAVNEDPPAHLGYAIDMAAVTASMLEAARANWSTALQIDDMVLKVVEQGWGDLAAALARKGVHLRASGRTQEARPYLDRAAELSAAAVDHEERVLTLPYPPTLDEALRTAGAATGMVGVAVLRRALSAEESYSATARVRDPAAAPAHARRLADIALAVHLDTDSPSAWRLALESHLLYHALFRKRADPEPGLRAYGDAWATALRVMVRISRTHGRQAMAEDVHRAVAYFTEKTAPVADEPRLRPFLDALRAESA